MSDDDTAEDFGDADPEDAWDDNDFFEQKLNVLTDVVDDLRAKHDERFEARRAEAKRLAQRLDEVKNMLVEHLRALREDLESL